MHMTGWINLLSHRFLIIVRKMFEGAFCRDAAHIGFSKEFASSDMSERIYKHSQRRLTLASMTDWYIEKVF